MPPYHFIIIIIIISAPPTMSFKHKSARGEPPTTSVGLTPGIELKLKAAPVCLFTLATRISDKDNVVEYVKCLDGALAGWLRSHDLSPADLCCDGPRVNVTGQRTLIVYFALPRPAVDKMLAARDTQSSWLTLPAPWNGPALLRVRGEGTCSFRLIRCPEQLDAEDIKSILKQSGLTATMVERAVEPTTGRPRCTEWWITGTPDHDPKDWAKGKYPANISITGATLGFNITVWQRPVHAPTSPSEADCCQKQPRQRKPKPPPKPPQPPPPPSNPPRQPPRKSTGQDKAATADQNAGQETPLPPPSEPPPPMSGEDDMEMDGPAPLPPPAVLPPAPSPPLDGEMPTTSQPLQQAGKKAKQRQQKKKLAQQQQQHQQPQAKQQQQQAQQEQQQTQNEQQHTQQLQQQQEQHTQQEQQQQAQEEQQHTQQEQQHTQQEQQHTQQEQQQEQQEQQHTQKEQQHIQQGQQHTQQEQQHTQQKQQHTQQEQQIQQEPVPWPQQEQTQQEVRPHQQQQPQQPLPQEEEEQAEEQQAEQPPRKGPPASEEMSDEPPAEQWATDQPQGIGPDPPTQDTQTPQKPHLPRGDRKRRPVQRWSPSWSPASYRYRHSLTSPKGRRSLLPHLDTVAEGPSTRKTTAAARAVELDAVAEEGPTELPSSPDERA